MRYCSSEYRSWCAYLAGCYEESKAEPKRSLEINPQNLEYFFGLGIALLACDQIEKARAAYLQGIKISERLSKEEARELVSEALYCIDNALYSLDKLLQSRTELELQIRKFKQLLKTAKDVSLHAKIHWRLLEDFN